MRSTHCLLAIAVSVSLPAQADEYYELHRVSCVEDIPSFEIERVGFWNIGHVIWPGQGTWEQQWQAHVAALRRLERSKGLYVLHDLYGYYDKPLLTWTCGPITATVKFQRVARPDEDGSLKFVRMHPRLSISVRSAVAVSDIALSPTRVRVYADDQSNAYVEVCGSKACREVINIEAHPLSDSLLSELLPE
jgi:hypothetical protein